jgi:membrane-associated protein
MEISYDQFVDFFMELSSVYKNLLIFLFAFGEGLPIVGTFLPGGTVAIFIGALSEEGFINPWKAIHIIAIGSLLGDLIGFFVGRKLLHFNWVRKIIYSKKQAKTWDLFDRHAALVIIIGKLVPLVRSTPALFAGARKMNILKYIVYVLIGSYIWGIAGIFGGKYLAQIFGNFLLPIILGIIIVSILVTIISQKRKKKEPS